MNEEIKAKLWQELDRRCRQNPRYSLRAFAKYLEIEPSALSKIMRGKRGISAKNLHKFSKNLGPFGEAPTAHYKSLDGTSFAKISAWHHYAILELTRTRNFQSNARYVASALKINVSEVLTAVEALKAVGLLQITEDGRWEDVSESLTNFDSPTTDHARRALQKQILRQAQLAVEEVPYDERLNTSMTLAINSKKLAEAKTKVRKFQRQLTAFLQAGELDQVYQISMALFPISKPKNKKLKNRSN